MNLSAYCFSSETRCHAFALDAMRILTAAVANAKKTQSIACPMFRFVVPVLG
jgi:hypothetical protein